MAGKVRKNASADTMLDYFREAVAKRGGTYYPNPAFDLLNMKQCLKYYDAPFLAELIDTYVFRTEGRWRTQDFVNRIPDLAEWIEKDMKSREAQKKLMQETKNRMREAGLY